MSGTSPEKDRYMRDMFAGLHRAEDPAGQAEALPVEHQPAAGDRQGKTDGKGQAAGNASIQQRQEAQRQPATGSRNRPSYAEFCSQYPDCLQCPEFIIEHLYFCRKYNRTRWGSDVVEVVVKRRNRRAR